MALALLPACTKGLVPTCLSQPDERLEKTQKMIERDKEFLRNVIHSESKKINTALVQGKVPPKKLHNWVNEAKQFERQGNDDKIWSRKNSKSSYLEVEQLIVDHLKKSPFKHGLVYDGPVSTPVKKNWHSTKYQVWISPDRHKHAEEGGKGAQRTKMERSEKSEIINTSRIDDSMSVLEGNVKSKLDTEIDLRSSLSFPRCRSPPVLVVNDEMKPEIEIEETGVQPLQRNDAKRIDAADSKEMEPGLSVQVADVFKDDKKFKVEIAETEVLPFPVTESIFLPDPTSATSIETEVEILPVKEMGFETVSYESEGRPLIPGGENLETLPSETEGLQSIHEIEEVEINPSEAEIEAHMAYDFSKGSVETMETLPSETEGLQSVHEIEELDISPSEAEREVHIAPDFRKGSLETTMLVTTSMLQSSNEAVAKPAIEMELVSIEEAWQLFQEQVGGVLDSPKIMNIAQEIVKECHGLLLTIIVTGKALRNENDVLVWEHALSQFQHLSKLTEHEDAIRRLEFSYDRLKDRDIKRCFLHCALMFVEVHEIKVDDLIENFIKEDLIHGTSSRARKKGQEIIKKLIDSSLLMESVNGGPSLRMPGMVKDLGLWIMTSKEEPYQGSFTEVDILSGAGKGSTEPPPKEEWERKKMIFLMNNDFSRLPEKPNCPNLLTLFLQKNRLLRSIPLSFFNVMPSLRVLNLSKTGIRSLPPSLFGLAELRDLTLCHCNCLDELPPEVGNLGHIEVLDLQGTELYNLPDEVGQLTSLRHLQISFYEAVDETEYDKLPRYLISRDIISKLVALQELHIVVHQGDQRWNESAADITRDVATLNGLTSLDFYFQNVNVLDLFIQSSHSWINNSLSKFKFIVGQGIKRIISRVPDHIELDYDQQDRCLRFVKGDDKMPNAVLNVLARATAFYLDQHCEIKSLSEVEITGIRELKFCILRECPNILTVIDSEENSECALQYLEHLSIHYLWKLESICNGPLPHGSFNGLKFLSVHTCPKLKIILEESMLQCLSNLEELVVEDCASVQKIIDMEEKTENDDFVRLPSLRKLSLLYLPQLVSAWNGVHSLMEITIYHCPKLENARKFQLAIEEIEA